MEDLSILIIYCVVLAFIKSLQDIAYNEIKISMAEVD